MRSVVERETRGAVEQDALERSAGPLRKPAPKREWRALLGWTLLAFLLRLFLVWRVEQVISPDGVEYVALARSLVAGHFREGLSTYWPPLYPLLVGLSSLVFRDAEFAGRLVSVLTGGLLVIASQRMIREWYGRRAALVGACLVALHPLLVYYSTTLLTESTYTLLFTSGVLAGWSALSGGRRRSYLLAGAAFGACYLLKPEAAGFLVLLLALILGRGLFVGAGSDTTPARNYRTSARDALLLCAGFMLLAAPYLIYLRRETGAWTLSGKAAAHMWQGSRLAGGDFDPVRLSPVPDPTTAVVQLTKALRFEYEIFNLIFPPAFVLLAGLGLFRKRWTGERLRRELYLCSFVAATLAGYAVTLPNIRFLMPLLPILLCWLSKGVVELAEWAGETLSGLKGTGRFLPCVRRLFVPLVVAGLLASLLPLSAYLLRGDKWGDYYGQKRAALWIKEHDASHAPIGIMSTAPITAFYAEGRHVALFDEDYASLVARARRERADYIIVNERDFRYMGPLRTLLDEQVSHAGLRLAFDFAAAPGHKILVYAVEETEEGETVR
jgi:4-amino-4-deoxy-L-arabinose transferase-like glycosyltransferase